jgi:uncharacterized membrane protein
MTARQIVLACGGILLALVVLDGVWLGLLMGGVYASFIGAIMLDQPRLVPAALFYVLYTAALYVFAVAPALRTGNQRSAGWLGAFLGLVAYGTYDLSNYATLTAWTWQLTVIDMAWGSALSYAAASAGFWSAHRWQR